MSQFENTKNILKGEIQLLVHEMMQLQLEVEAKLKEIEEKKLIAQELEEAVRKLSDGV